MSLIRTRWAALGAAVAVALGGGGIGLVSATNPAAATTFIAITPCRVIDTRPDPAFNVGPKSSPLGPNEEHAVTAVGNSGDCTEVPANATAVALNVTALNATRSTFLTVYASNVTRPGASSLNPEPGSPPTPNAVTTGLSPGGQFTVFNRFGNVDVIADINGYYVDHNHDDRYYTKDEVNARTLGVRVEWMNVSANGSIRSSSPGLAGMSIERPASEPTGHYCIVGSPPGLSGEAAVGSIQHGHGGNTPRTMLVTATFGNACNSVAGTFLVVETFAANDKVNASFMVMIPRS